jgi:hypothetical protein
MADPFPPFRTNPSDIARYFFHDCERFLYYTAATPPERRRQGLPKPDFDHSPLVGALLDSGHRWEEEVVRGLLAGRVVVAPGGGAPGTVVVSVGGSVVVSVGVVGVVVVSVVGVVSVMLVSVVDVSVAALGVVVVVVLGVGVFGVVVPVPRVRSWAWRRARSNGAPPSSRWRWTVSAGRPVGSARRSRTAPWIVPRSVGWIGR